VAERDRAPSLLETLKRYDWHERAACYGEPDPNLFFPDVGGSSTKPSSPRMLLPLLICSTCSVRRECLEECYASWDFVRGHHERDLDFEGRRLRGLPETQEMSSKGVPWAKGIWGGTTEEEREAARVEGLTKEEAVEALYDTMEDRLRVRIDAYLERRTSAKVMGPLRYRERVDAMLEGTDARSER
jgi:hypothetical protein